MQQPIQSFSAHLRAMLALGVPLIASNLAQFAIHMTDTVMLGWYDVTALAAATLASGMFFVVFIVGAGFAQAVTPMVAAAAEAGDDTQVRRVTRMSVWLSVLYGLALTAPFLLAERTFLAIGQDPDVAAEAQRYLTIAVLGMIPALITMVFKSFLAALEMTAVILWSTIGAALMNVVLNYALIFGNLGAPQMGIRGAAVASVIVQLVSAAILVIYALRQLPQFALLQRVFRPDPEIMGRVFRLGLPIGLTSLAESGLFTAAAIMVGWIGAVPLAAHGIALQLAAMMFMVHIGLSQAATVRAGRALGRADPVGLRRGALAALVCSAGFVVITVTLFLTLPETLVSLFVDPAAPERAALLQTGTALVMVAALFQTVDALQVMMLGLLRGVQDTTVPMAMAVVSYWFIGMPASYFMGFGLGLGAVGIWLGLVVGLSIAGALMTYRFWTRRYV